MPDKNRDKQIEEMAKIACDSRPPKIDKLCKDCTFNYLCDIQSSCEALYTAGYRKASDGAEEIFAEIEKVVGYALCVDLTDWSAYTELKKKYTEVSNESKTT